MELEEIACRLHTLKSIKGKNAKIEFLSKECDEPFIKYLLVVLFDSQYTLGLKSIGTVGMHCDKTLVRFFDLRNLIEKLRINNTNDALRTEVVQFLGKCSKPVQDIIKPLLQKTLKLGVTANTFNKVFPGMIQEHPIALAKSPTEAHIKVPCILGKKYDGIRYTWIDDDLKVFDKRTGKALTRDRNRMYFKSIEKGIAQLLNGVEERMVVDGELETLDEDFDKVQGIVSSNIDHGTYESGNDSYLKFTVFDIIRYSDYIGETKSAPLKDRLMDLEALFMTNRPKHLVLAEQYTVHSIEKVQSITNAKIEAGEEGTIVKDPNAPYKKGKTSAWIKQKAINETTLMCVGVTNGTNKREGKVGALMMESSCGLIKVKVGSGLTDEMVELFTKEPPICKFFDVLFNQVSQADSGQMSLRLPRLKGHRVDVVNADDFEKIKSQHIGAMKLKGL